MPRPKRQSKRDYPEETKKKIDAFMKTASINEKNEQFLEHFCEAFGDTQRIKLNTIWMYQIQQLNLSV